MVESYLPSAPTPLSEAVPPWFRLILPPVPSPPPEAVPPWFRRLSARGQAKPVESDKLKAGMYGVVRR